MANTRQKQKTRSANAGGSGDILLAAFIMRPQSESQIGAELDKLYVKARAWHPIARISACFAYTLWLDRYMFNEFVALNLTFKKKHISLREICQKGKN